MLTAAWAIGLDLALEWGVIAFVLNYIPFIGPLLATVLPALVAGVQFGSPGSAALVFIIQNIIGSGVEPRITGSAVAISPFIVLLPVFFWAFLWVIAGAFIGIPIVNAVLTGCAAYPSTRWVAVLRSESDADRP